MPLIYEEVLQMKELKQIRKAIRGNQTCLQQLLRANSVKLYKIINLYTNDVALSKEVIYESNIACQNSISLLKNEEYFFTWILRKHITIAIAKCQSNTIRFPQLNEPYRTVAILLYGAALTDEMISSILHCDRSKVFEMATQVSIDLNGNTQQIADLYNEMIVPYTELQSLYTTTTKKSFLLFGT